MYKQENSEGKPSAGERLCDAAWLATLICGLRPVRGDSYSRLPMLARLARHRSGCLCEGAETRELFTCVLGFLSNTIYTQGKHYHDT